MANLFDKIISFPSPPPKKEEEITEDRIKQALSRIHRNIATLQDLRVLELYGMIHITSENNFEYYFTMLGWDAYLAYA